VTLVVTLLVTSASHGDVSRLPTSLQERSDVTTRLAADVMDGVERSLLGDARQQRNVWRRDVTACQRHVTQLTAHVAQLTSGDSWRRLDTYELPGLLLFRLWTRRI